MTISLDPKVIGAIHGALKSIPERRNVIPVCGTYLLEPTETGISVTATDMDIEATISIEMASTDIVATCIQPYLLEAAAGLRAEMIKIVIDDQQATFSAGRARFKAPVLPGGDFPRAAHQFDHRFTLAGEALATLIASTVDAVSTEETRYYLQGVFVDCHDGRLHAVATDGHRLHTTSVAMTDAATLDYGIIIPTKAAKEIERLARKAGGNAVIIETSRSGIAVKSGDERIVSKLVDGNYPDWRRVVPKESDNALTIDLGEMLAALDRVLKIQTVNEADMKLKTAAVRLSVDGDALTIQNGGRNTIAGAVDGVACEVMGDWAEHGVNGRYLRITLAALKDRGVETITINSADSGSPMRLESPTDEDFLAIVMPMRV
ncbi:DNA polymerase III subunit beta [Mesorhizobium sp. CAU 1732]|uniref:DNA polymerase III subunit beta n=1 Tax=Mesorhizobium sp. CAU 1732 TaxID=3140358 RepID=UPI0032606DC6